MRKNKARHAELSPGDADWYEIIKQRIPELEDYKKSTILHVKDRAVARGCGTLEAYCRLLEKDPGESAWLRSNLTLSGTSFFRGRGWDFLRSVCMPELAKRGSVKVWCAGCAGGEEVYSVIMALLDHVPADAIELLATDYNEAVLQRCREGTYYVRLRRYIPEEYRHYAVPVFRCRSAKDLARTVVRRPFTFPDGIRNIIRTEKVNLLTDPYPEGSDLILCRNVMKFFSPDVIPAVQERLAASLAENGFLFVSEDPKEQIEDPEKMSLRQTEETTVYQKTS